jgi:hypothetical protein
MPAERFVRQTRGIIPRDKAFTSFAEALIWFAEAFTRFVEGLTRQFEPLNRLSEPSAALLNHPADYKNEANSLPGALINQVKPLIVQYPFPVRANGQWPYAVIQFLKSKLLWLRNYK